MYFKSSYRLRTMTSDNDLFSELYGTCGTLRLGKSSETFWKLYNRYDGTEQLRFAALWLLFVALYEIRTKRYSKPVSSYMVLWSDTSRWWSNWPVLVPGRARRSGRTVPKYHLGEEDWWSRDKTCDSPVNNTELWYGYFAGLWYQGWNITENVVNAPVLASVV